jgi:hypothetical protein
MCWPWARESLVLVLPCAVLAMRRAGQDGMAMCLAGHGLGYAGYVSGLVMGCVGLRLGWPVPLVFVSWACHGVDCPWAGLIIGWRGHGLFLATGIPGDGLPISGAGLPMDWLVMVWADWPGFPMG